MTSYSQPSLILDTSRNERTRWILLFALCLFSALLGRLCYLARPFDNDAAKEDMRFGAGDAEAKSARNAGSSNAAGTRAHIGWFGITVASCERGDVRQSPNGLYVYDANGRREIPVSGGRGTGMLEMREMFECLSEGTPIVHDGHWALATLEV